MHFCNCRINWSLDLLIINLLIKRKYIFQDKNGIEPTELGFTILNTMKKFVSEIISTKLTSSLESSIKKIQEGDLEIGDIRVYLESIVESHK